MRRALDALRRFFFPSPHARPLIRLLPYLTLGLITLFVLVGGVYAWDYTNSPEFCGTVCHTMPPEYTAYLVSPHARVDCVECHIGRGFIATRVTRKAGDIQHVLATAFQTYEFPIRAHNLRPARETCERCHSPDKFSDDSLREIRRFGDDPEHPLTSTYLLMRTGGGSAREGLGRGIHWHIENPVLFLALDELQQSIPYVRVPGPDGTYTEYMDLNAGLDPAAINPADLIEMDCITCHNRITHLIYTPEHTIDQLMGRGLIDPSIPEIRRRALAAYSAEYADVEQALQGLAALETYYQQAYPDVYLRQGEAIRSAIAALQAAYRNSVFPEQRVDWNTHPNNLGHREAPGCFRCHGGTHLNAEGEAVRLECNLCHAIPVVAGPGDLVARLEISRGPEPQSHLNPNWITLHREVFDPTCANCHTTEDPGGVSDTSFCSNSACHGIAWTFAGFDAPGLRELLRPQLPPTPAATALPTGAALTYANGVGDLLAARCGSCHGPGGIQGLNVTTYADLLAGGAGGPAVVPGDPQASLLIVKQTGASPHFGQLPAGEVERLIEWIAAGAPER